MKRLIMTSVTVIMAALTASASSRSEEVQPHAPFSNAALSIDISTMGPGISATVPVSRNIFIKGSYWLLPICSKSPINDSPTAIASMPGNRAIEIERTGAQLQFSSHTVRLVADYVPFRQGTGIFYISGGLMYSNSRIFEYSELYDISPLKEFGIADDEMDNVQLTNNQGTYWLGNDGKVTNTSYRPNFGLYFGIGIGRPVPVRKVGFRAEIGVPIHIGTYRWESDGMISSSNDIRLMSILYRMPGEQHGVFASLCMNFHVTFRLFNGSRK